MKKLLVGCLILISIKGLAQIDTLDKKTVVEKEFNVDDNGNYQFTQVFNLDSIKSPQLYKNAKVWFTEFFKSAKDVIQMEDKESGLIVGKGLSYLKSSHYLFNFTIKIEVKEGRYKLYVEQMTIKRPLNAAYDDDSLTIMKKGETLPIEAICPNGKLKKEFKMYDALNKAEIWATLYDIKNTLHLKMQKKDDW